MARKSTSCTLCYVDQFLLTSECKGQRTVALSLRALSAELIFTQAIMKEIGLSFLIHARADRRKARAVATKQGAIRRMRHMHSHQKLMLSVFSFWQLIRVYSYSFALA